MKDYIQIAGVRDIEEARMLTDAGVSAIGLPLRLDVNDEDITEDEAARLIRTLHKSIRPVLITYIDSAREVVNFCGYLGVSWVQLHGDITPREISSIRKSTPELRIIKSLIVRGDNSSQLRDAVETFSPLVNAFITDTYDPETGATGATGMVHDWDVSRQIVEISDRPVILAGGLAPSNVRDAILHVQPAGVDVHSGVEESSGKRDPELVHRFVTQAKAGFTMMKTVAETA